LICVSDYNLYLGFCKTFPSKSEKNMSDSVNAELVAIGTEILLGEITDTNSVYLAQQLRDIGINVYYMTSVGDNRGRIADAIRLALSRADIVITCGGLGPTVDDVTRQGIADAVEHDLEFHESLYNHIVARFESYRVQMSENNRQQAFLPSGAIPIENPVGTAPGFMVEQNNKVVISLPGVPRELKFLMQETVIPYLLENYQPGVIRSRILRTAGIGESDLDTRIGSNLLEGSNPTVGLAAHHGIIDIRLTAKAASTDEAEAMLDDVEAKVREQAGTFIFGTGTNTLEDVLADRLRHYNLNLCLVEAGLDDAIAAKLQAAGVYDDCIAHAQSYAHPDALDTVGTLRQQAETLAQQLTDAHNTAGAIVILSMPDVNEQSDSDHNTAVSVYVDGQHKTRTYGFGGQSNLVREWVSRWGMSAAWRMITDRFDDRN
jgi:nicotinamide-nucleotide amidase